MSNPTADPVLTEEQMAEAIAKDIEGLKAWLTENVVEGIVWHHDDGRMAKIKRRDFGLKW